MQHQVDVRRQIRHELDDRHFSIFVTERQCKDRPNRRANDKRNQQRNELEAGPGETAVPEFLWFDIMDI